MGKAAIGGAAVIGGAALIPSSKIFQATLAIVLASIVYQVAVAVALRGSLLGLEASDVSIITAVLETLMNLVDFGMTPQAAVAAPRFHQQYLPDTVFYETGGLPAPTLTALGTMGYSLKDQPRWSAVELIAITPDGALTGVSDRRRPAGAALGY